MVLLIIYDFL
jgi:hypothetical protein